MKKTTGTKIAKILLNALIVASIVIALTSGFKVG